MIRSRIVSVLERADAVAAGALCLLLAVFYAVAGVAGWSLASLPSLLAAVRPSGGS